MRYESYKPSGVAWLGEIPKHWETRPLKSVIKKSIGGVWGKDPLNMASDIVCLRVSDFDSVKGEFKISKLTKRSISPTEKNGRLLEYGNLVIEKSGGGEVTAVGRVVLFNHAFPAVCSNFTNKLVVSDSIDSIFALKLFQTLFNCKINIKHIKQTTGIQNLDLKSYFNEQIILPPIEEQESIVRYLSFYEHKINKAIHVKKKLIATLSEQKQAIIAHAVTKGVDLHVKMKESGISWLSEIPEHWEMKKLRTILKPIAVRNKPDLPLLSVVREKGIIVRDTENKEENHNFIPEDLSNYKVVKNGQFVMNKMKAWQGSYGVSSYDGIVSPAYYVFDLKEVSSDFFHKALRSKVYVPFFTHASDGVRIGQWDLSQSRMKEIPFWIPSIEEQKVIVEFIEQETVTIDKAIELSKKEIELLQEYKTRLIADVVTGAVDVRKEAQNLPEVEEDSIVFEDDVFEAQEEGGDE